MTQTPIVNPFEGTGLQEGIIGTANYVTQYADRTTLDISALIGSAYSPDGIAVINGDQILFTNLTTLTGPTGRGVYQAVVVAGKVTAWIKVIFGQSPSGDSVDGDSVFIQRGTAYADHTFECIDTLTASWQDLGLMRALKIKDEGTVIDSDVSEMNFVGDTISATSTGAGTVQIEEKHSYTKSFLIADWTLDMSSPLYYFNVVHNLGTLLPDVNVYNPANLVYMHEVEVIDANTIKLWIVSNPDTRFDGSVKVIK